jgi:hypothetical protein
MSDDPTGRIIELLIDLQTGQSAIMERLDRHEQRMDRLDEGLDRLRTDVMARMDRLQDALTLHKDDMVTSMGAGERAERIANAMQDVVRTLSEQVTVMVRQIHRLQTEMRELKGES